MAQHVQQSMPPHLEKYRGGNTYIPQHAQEEMTQHLENTLPPHMKQYAGAYMQQRVVEPSLARRGTVNPALPPEAPGATVSPPAAQPNFGNPLAQGLPGAAPGQSVTPQTQPAPAATQAQATAPPSPDQAYSFIMNPEKPPKQFFLNTLFTGKSVLARAAIVAGGLIVLLIVFSLLRGLLSSKPDLTSYMSVVQQQQELLHLTSASGGSAQQSLSVGNVNLATTIKASLTTSQAKTIKYMVDNGQKIDAKQLNLKVSAKTDAQLKDAASAGNYNQAYREAIESELNTYANTLKTAYSQSPGPRGKALMKDSYAQLQLFQVQFQESATQ